MTKWYNESNLNLNICILNNETQADTTISVRNKILKVLHEGNINMNNLYNKSL